MPADTGRIKTRSQARAQPDQYTQISAKLKLIKILVEELSNSAGAQDLDADAAAAMDEELSGEEWEDEPNAFANLESQSVKERKPASNWIIYSDDMADTYDRIDGIWRGRRRAARQRSRRRDAGVLVGLVQAAGQTNRLCQRL